MALYGKIGLALLSIGLGCAQTPSTGSGYVDPSVCATCHQSIAESYARTGMGRSFSTVRATDTVPAISGSIFHHEASDQFFSLSTTSGKPSLKRYEPGFDGRIANLLETTLDYRIGSGNHAVSYLHRTAAGELMELPLTWYADKGGSWAMSPGFDRPDHGGVSRKVSYRCMFCHNAYPAVEPGSDRLESATYFPASLPEGIDCQRCHGPGGEHVSAVRQGKPPQVVRSSIVNPARLDNVRQMEVCLQCHLEVTSLNLPEEIMRYGRGVFSYQPGEPLTDYAQYFDHASGTGHDDKFELVSAPYRLEKSACFRSSGGRLTCTTCHNPHQVPRSAAAATYYAKVCRSCHQEEVAKLAGSGRHPNGQDCDSCHMVKRRAADAIHIAVTDHFIQRRPEGDLPGLVERHEGNTPPYRGEVVPYYPSSLPATPDNKLYLAVAQVQFQANLAEGLPRLAAAIAKYSPRQGDFYFRLGEAYRAAGQIDKAIVAYQQACERAPDWRFFYALGSALTASGQLDGAVQALDRARSLAPREVAILHALAAVYAKQGKGQSSVDTLKAALAIDPDSADTRNNLGVISLELGRTTESEEFLREAIRLRPEVAPTRLNLADLLERRGSLTEAVHEFQAAVRIDAKSATARSGYAAALVAMGDTAGARAQYEEAIRLNPQLSETHDSLGSILLQSGDVQGAIREYRLALAGNPDSATILYNLALALSQQGDAAGAEQNLRSAIEREPGLFLAHLRLGQLLLARGRSDLAEPYLRKAAGSPDPRVQQAAQDLLKRQKQ